MQTATANLLLLETVITDAIAGCDDALASIHDVAGWVDVADSLPSFVLSVREQVRILAERGLTAEAEFVATSARVIEDNGLSGGREIRVLVGSPGYLHSAEMRDADTTDSATGHSYWWATGRSWRKMWNGKYSLQARGGLAGKRVAEWHGEDVGFWHSMPHIYN